MDLLSDLDVGPLASYIDLSEFRQYLKDKYDGDYKKYLLESIKRGSVTSEDILRDFENLLDRLRRCNHMILEEAVENIRFLFEYGEAKDIVDGISKYSYLLSKCDNDETFMKYNPYDVFKEDALKFVETRSKKDILHLFEAGYTNPLATHAIFMKERFDAISESKMNMLGTFHSVLFDYSIPNSTLAKFARLYRDEISQYSLSFQGVEDENRLRLAEEYPELFREVNDGQTMRTIEVLPSDE